ncbi:unnamed protein product [Lactuca virosa]|uniref:Uncharacterized protein n=1 Tax=Lactuca virosa TaxID=75947 RepID=A0AAU9M6M3_9ASTR|nr:unnamed protein product [Lactuca virosa]
MGHYAEEWKIYDRLMRLESNISYDSMRKIIIASLEWWEEKIKGGDKEYAKFRDKNLKIYETYYEKLFRDSVAIGAHMNEPIDFEETNTNHHHTCCESDFKIRPDLLGERFKRFKEKGM